MKLRNCKYICSTGGKRDGEDIVENLNVLENHWDCGFYSNHTQTFLSLLKLKYLTIYMYKYNTIF